MLSSSRTNAPRENLGEIVKQGNLKKLKTMKRKYFVLRADSGESCACLEYYENEKKFKANCPPKRIIKLKNCFNINRLIDKKNKFVIGLYSHVGCFCIVFDTEEELVGWLEALLRLQHGENLPVGEAVKPFFEHVWKVEVMEREMGSRMGILGPYHVCLTNQVISLIKATNDDTHSTINFYLEKLRACGHMNTFFYMQVGNDTVTGAGNLWMTTGDATIAESMHTTIMKACARCHKDPVPKFRTPSSSAGESSKPASILQRWPTHTGECVTSPRNVASLRPSERRHSVAAGAGNAGIVAICHQRTYSFPLSPATSSHGQDQQNNCLTQVRDKYDCMAGSRPRTISESNHLLYNRPRPNSICNKTNSPPVHSSLLSPLSVACSTDSAGSSMSMEGEGDWDETYVPKFLSLTPDEPVIVEENSDEYPAWPQVEDEKLNNYMQMGSSTSSITNTSYRKISPNPFPQSIKSNSPSQGSLADVYSPVSSSPLETLSGYMPMSPVDVRLAPFTGSHSHSRVSSVDDIGYMTTGPSHCTAHSDDGYVDMDQKNNRERYQSCSNTSGGSSCSLTTSGTPSGDLTKLSEYSLDRVSSGIGPEELRPARAYSVGSRPHNTNNKSESLGGGEEKRVRAFSVGSHQQGSRIMASIGRMAGSLRSNASNTSTTLSSQPLSQSHSSMEPADDLMEMDFTKRAKHIKNMRTKKPSSAEKLSDTGLSPPKPNRLVAALFGRSPPKIPVSPPQGHPSPSLDRVPEAEPGYLEMTIQRGDTYMEMKPVVAPVKHTLKPQNFPKITSHQASTGVSHQPPIKPALFSSKPLPECYVDMNLKRKTSLVEDNNNSKIVISQNQVQTNNGYVEMHIKTSCSPLPQKQESNYMNMGGSNKPEKRHHRKDRRFSQPIKIQAKELARKITPSTLPISSASTNGSAGSADSNRSVDSNRLEHGSDDSKNGSLESKVFVSIKSPCNACDYVMFNATGSGGSTSDPMADYTMMGPPSLPSRGNEPVDLLRTGISTVTLLDAENMSRHSEDEPNTDSSKSLSRASSTASVGEKEVEYASLDLKSDDDRLAAPPPQPHSYARIDFNFESNKLKN